MTGEGAPPLRELVESYWKNRQQGVYSTQVASFGLENMCSQFVKMSRTIAAFFVLAFLMAWNPSVAVDEKEYAKCVAIQGDLARLDCFDTLAKKHNLDGAQVRANSIAGKGNWEVFNELNPVDDSETVKLLLEADSGKSPWGEPVYLVVRCRSNNTELFIGWGDVIAVDEASVLTRVGKNKAVTRLWNTSTNLTSTFHRKPISFIKEMMASTALLAQVTPYGANPVTAIFNTSGLEKAIRPLRETCGW